MYLLGYDLGSSSIKASLLDVESGICLASDFSPHHEMRISAPQIGWAEQDPLQWWNNLCLVTHSILQQADIDTSDISAIGIAYQMHGLVTVDKNGEVLRPAIIWCDSRAVSLGETAFNRLGHRFCLEHLLNSPGNFTASKLSWIRKNEPEIFDRIHKIMLPGDYLAFRLTDNIQTTKSGLSEGIFWDFSQHDISRELLHVLGLSEQMLATQTPTFGVQGYVTRQAADELGLQAGIPVTYRAGDQPNNALSLNVLNPGEIAATAGTSGTVYGVGTEMTYDPASRVNTFLHVNHTEKKPRFGILLCINGAGSLNSWLKHNIALPGTNYHELDNAATQIPIGSEGISVIPFGNGAERILCNRDIKASFHGINFNIHDNRHLLRASQEGIAFSLCYGIDIMKSMGLDISVIRAGNTNMFLSPVFRDSLAGVTGAEIELYDTDGSQGAARGAGLGAGIYASPQEAFSSLRKIATVTPSSTDRASYKDAYARWNSCASISNSFNNY